MIRSPLPVEAMQPGYRAFRAKLFLTTRIDKLLFGMWLRVNRQELYVGFFQSEEARDFPDELAKHLNAVEDRLGIWLRFKYVRTEPRS